MVEPNSRSVKARRRRSRVLQNACGHAQAPQHATRARLDSDRSAGGTGLLILPHVGRGRGCLYHSRHALGGALVVFGLELGSDYVEVISPSGERLSPSIR
jgi:hypothetical protein